jgi:hypothetical protein
MRGRNNDNNPTSDAAAYFNNIDDGGGGRGIIKPSITWPDTTQLILTT